MQMTLPGRITGCRRVTSERGMAGPVGFLAAPARSSRMPISGAGAMGVTRSPSRMPNCAAEEPWRNVTRRIDVSSLVAGSFVDKIGPCNPVGVKMMASGGNLVEALAADLTPTLARQVMEQLRRAILEGVHQP